MFTRAMIVVVGAWIGLGPVVSEGQESASRRLPDVNRPSTSQAAAPLLLDDSDADTQPRQKPAEPKPKKKPAPAPNPYKGVFYDNDFRYLDSAPPQFLGDHFKRLHPHDCWIFDFGGEYRLRDHHEHHLRFSDLSGRNDDFLLQRTRLYANAEYAGWLRLYAEAIDATSAYENYPPRTIEENRFDALNLFADALLLADGDSKLWARVGRQELLYGEQRLISPLDWANTRRTFDGAKVFYRSTTWDADAFWVRPVPFAQHQMNDHNFDRPDQSQEFMGLYTTYKGRKNHVHDYYFLRLAEYDGQPVNFDVSLFGTRWKAKSGSWLWEFEGAYQFGSHDIERQSAGFATFGLGHEFCHIPWKPTLWAYYDWASGDRDPGDGVHGTFNQLFPLGHKYFGFADLVARQNIRDFNLLLTAQPHKKINLLLWWHVFHLDQARDALYNANGAAIRIDPTGNSGRYAGQELDFTLQYTFNPRCDVLFGYSHFFPGDFVKNTNPPGVTGDVDFYYSQWTYRF